MKEICLESGSLNKHFKGQSSWHFQARTSRKSYSTIRRTLSEDDPWLKRLILCVVTVCAGSGMGKLCSNSWRVCTVNFRTNALGNGISPTLCKMPSLYIWWIKRIIPEFQIVEKTTWIQLNYISQEGIKKNSIILKTNGEMWWNKGKN